MDDDFADFINHLSDDARLSVQYADAIARGYGNPYIGTEHLLLGILSQHTSVGTRVLEEAGVTLRLVEQSLNLQPIRGITVRTGGATGLSETAVLALRMSWEFAKEYNYDEVGTEHILYSLLKQNNARATVVLRKMGADTEAIATELEARFDEGRGNQVGDTSTMKMNVGRQRSTNGGIIEKYGTDLTARASNGELDAVVGRTRETERLVTILSRRTKNNPVLIGEPGVGKTAVVEGLAQRIAREDVPDVLLDKRLVMIDLPAMIAGTKYRGEFEDRLTKLVREVKKQGNVIIFIDELHLLVGAGTAEGASMDAANILKPALARGELRLIGATTIDEYRRHIEKDSALERRLQTVLVKQPTTKESIAILKGLRGYYEKHHAVKISDEVIEATVYMAERYIADRFMPDKAIDVLDEAAALVRVKKGHKPSKQREYARELKTLNGKMEDAVAAEDYERAALYKQRISQLTEKLDEETQREQAHKTPTVLKESDIARAIAVMTSIPVEKVQTSEAKLLTKLEKHLGKYIIGQEEAVHTVAKAIRRSRSGVASYKRPIGSFIFMGPTGVGKTELARVLAREVFGSTDALIKIDMSEFGEKHTTSRLVGAPAGYVGYEDGGKLTDKVRRQPYSVVLFDEIEKAHPDVFQMLLQLLEDGTLTDSKGRAVSFRNTIVILTSNLGADKMQKSTSLGFHSHVGDVADDNVARQQRNEAYTREALERFMRPELINRFDGIITFRPLTRREIGKIFDLQIAKLNRRLARQGLGVVVTSAAKKWLVQRGYSQTFGARPLRRTIENELEHSLAEGILLGCYKKGMVLKVGYTKGALTIEPHTESA